MTLVAKIDGVTLPDGALLIRGAPNSSLPGGIQGLPTAAWYGEAPQGGIQLDDPEGDLDSVLTIDGLHTFTVDETACTGKERIWSGWLTASGVSRGPYKDGPGRIWDVDIIDINWLFALEVFRASSAKRPAETDIVRAPWAMASAPMAGTPIHDNGRANFTDNPRNFGDSDYVTKYPIELFNSITATVGKQFYAYWDHDADEISLHYDMIGVGPTSTLAISNVIADKDSTTHYPFLDADLKRDPAWRVTGILFGYRGAYAYNRRQATIDSLSPSEFSPNEFRRDEVYTTDRVGEAATANALIETMLDERALDIHTISVSIRVPNSQVNLVEAGDLIDVKFSHLPGYEDFVTMPVIRRNVVPTDGRTDMYDIHLELRSVAKAAGPGGGPGSEFPHQPAECDPSVLQSKTGSSNGINVSVTLDDDPTPDNVLVAYIVLRDTDPIVTPHAGVGNDFTQIETQQFDDDGQSFAMYYRPVEAGDSATILSGPGNPSHAMRMVVAELTGVNVVLGDSAAVSDDTFWGPDWTQPLGSVNATAGGIILSGAIAGNSPAGDLIPSPTDGGVTIYASGINGGGPAKWFGYKLTTEDGAYEPEIDWDDPGSDPAAHGQAGISAFFACGDEGSLCPDAGQWVRDEFVAEGDGTTVSFFTRCPYADGSLNVRVDGHPILAGLTETDPATGEFTLDFAPLAAVGDSAAERVIVSYQGR